MTKNLSISTGLFIAAIFSQFVMMVLNAHLLWQQSHAPKVWSLDSSSYYKFLEGQGRLNLRIYEQQQSHEERLRKLDKKRQARHRQIDSLSGPALQSEIDRLYNRSGRQQPARGGGNPNHRPYDGPAQTDSTNGSRRASGSEGQSRSDHASGRSAIAGHFAQATASGNQFSESDHSNAERKAAGRKEPGHDCPEPGRPLPEPVARSTVGELAGTNRSRRVRSGEIQTHLTYWRLIQRQGYTYPEIAWAISAVETGYWWTPARGNNLFGMRKNGRGFYAGLTSDGYCRYRHKLDSLADYRAYEQQVIAKYKLRSKADYLSHIHRRYCPTATYRGKLALALKTLKALA